MLVALVLSGALSLTQAVKPPDYSERSLCELLAGAQCHVAKCGDNADLKCKNASKKCKARDRTSVPKDEAEKVANCAKALLKKQCSEPMPAECSGIPL